MSDEPVKFSVVVPACERPDQLAQCLTRLAPGTQTYPAADYEVTVTDDSQGTDVRELVGKKFPWAKWTAGPRRGPAANRNHGAAEAKNEWIAFTDDDCLPDTNWLAALASAIQSDPLPVAWEGATIADRPQIYMDEAAPLNTHGGYLWSCNLAVRREIFLALRGFDERFHYAAMEDVDFRERLVASGHRFAFAVGATICHPWRIQHGARTLRRHHESFYLYLRLHPELSVRQQGLIRLRTAARLLLKEWPAYLLRGRFRGSGWQCLRISSDLAIGLRLWLTGRVPQ